MKNPFWYTKNMGSFLCIGFNNFHFSLFPDVEIMIWGFKKDPAFITFGFGPFFELSYMRV